MRLTSTAFEAGETIPERFACEGQNVFSPYYWRLYALDAPCDLGPGLTWAQVFDWMPGYKLDASELMARFTGREHWSET